MKRFLSLALALLMALSILVSCAPSEEPLTPENTKQETQETPEVTEPPAVETDAPTEPTDAPTEPTEPEAELTVFPLTVTDQIGNEVTIEAPAERIVSGYYISSSTCLALGLKDKLVATEEKIEARPIYGLSAPDLIGNIGNVGSAKAFDLEACLAAEPDLVILPARAKEHGETLTEMGIPTIIVNPESHEQLVEMVTLIGQVADAEEAANKLIDRYDEVIAKVNDLTADLTEDDKPLVYMSGTSSYLTTAPKDMYQSSVITSAGGINAAQDIDGDYWVDVSYEQLIAMNPDVIIIPTNNMANGQPDFSAEELMADEVLAEVTAVANGAVYNMPAGYEAWDSPVPSGVLGMLWMLSTLHPDLYSLDEFALDAQDFYKTFYGFEMDTATILD